VAYVRLPRRGRHCYLDSLRYCHTALTDERKISKAYVLYVVYVVYVLYVVYIKQNSPTAEKMGLIVQQMSVIL
jgi:hypothetical protein